MVASCFLAKPVCGGPILSVNIASLQKNADLVCVGIITQVNVLGSETISISEGGTYLKNVEADLLEAKMSVSFVLKGEADSKITIRSHRNLMAWMPGITEGAYVTFLRREGDHFLPIDELAFVIPLDPAAVAGNHKTLPELLKVTATSRKSDLVRPAMDALSQVVPAPEFLGYADELAMSHDEHVAGVALLYLVRAGQRNAVSRAQSFVDRPHAEKETKYLADEISRVLGQSIHSR